MGDCERKQRQRTTSRSVHVEQVTAVAAATGSTARAQMPSRVPFVPGLTKVLLNFYALAAGGARWWSDRMPRRGG